MLIKKNLINKLLFFPLSVTGISILLGCSSQKIPPSIAPKSVNKTDSQKSINASDANTDLSQKDSLKKDLTVDPHRCIGCGKCTQIAPENFQMNARKAIVVSNKKTNYLTQAIDICPVDAISS